MGNWLQPRLHLKVSQKQILTPGLVQMVSVLALNRLELREMINQEMVANPILEEVTEDVPATDNYSDETFLKAETEKVPETEAANPFDEFDIASFHQYLDTGADNGREREEIERPSFEMFLSSPQRLADHLIWQLRASTCSEPVRQIAESIIGNLDEDGYLMMTLEDLAASGGFSVDDAEEAMYLVQEFDPLGVAARNLRECLLIQLRTLDPHNTIAQEIVSKCLPLRPQAAKEDPENPEAPVVRHFQNGQWKEVAKALDRTVEQVQHAVEVIRSLDPRPGLRYNRVEARVIEPDVYFRKSEEGWQAFLNEEDMPQLRLSPIYRRLMARDAADRDVRTYVKERFNAAIQLLKNIEQRKHTILRVCQVIIRRQGEFLDRGADHLKPLMIKEVAEEVGVHPSTVSRAVASKYAHTPQGLIELRSFFSESVNGPGGSNISLQTLKRRVKKMIEEEDTTHPLTDEQIAKRLDEEGIHVTRRTVAKYREDMRIPSTHQRRVKS